MGFRFIDYVDDEEFDGVLYNGITLRKTDSDLNLIRIENQSLCRVWAQVGISIGPAPTLCRARTSGMWLILLSRL